jgi:hypothetical protein
MKKTLKLARSAMIFYFDTLVLYSGLTISGILAVLVPDAT